MRRVGCAGENGDPLPADGPDTAALIGDCPAKQGALTAENAHDDGAQTVAKQLSRSAPRHPGDNRVVDDGIDAEQRPLQAERRQTFLRRRVGTKSIEARLRS